MPPRKQTPKLPSSADYSSADYERDTITAARAGDPDAALEALDLFVSGVDAGELSRPLLRYIADRIADIVHNPGIAPDVALRIKRVRHRGHEYDPVEVAATYFLLLRRGHKREAAKAKMQAKIFNKKLQRSGGIDRRLIERTAKEYAEMKKLPDDILLDMTGSVRKLVARLIP